MKIEELRAAVAAMPDDTPAGPWYNLSCGVGAARACAVCGVAILVTRQRHYRLVADDKAWQGAVTHGQCGRLARMLRFQDMDLVHQPPTL